MNATQQAQNARERRALALLVGMFGGALFLWILAELTVRVTPYADLLHIALALTGGLIGMAVAHWRVPRVAGGSASDA